MGKFKEFIENGGNTGLGDLGRRISQLYHSQEFGNQIGGAITNSDWTGTEVGDTLTSQGHPLHLPSTDLTLSSIEKTGRITTLMDKRNPIYVRLSDGTEANFTWDEYKRIEGEPALGKTMTLIFQRHPEDSSRMYSKVDKAIVRN